MHIALYLFIALLALSALVFFHELGHYSAGKFFGVHIERFSVGFGKVLTRTHFWNTEWVFSAIPLGGYVKMKGQNDADPTEVSYDSDSYNAKKPWQRIIILLAGPFANFILAFFVYLMIGFMDTPNIVARGYQAPIVDSFSEVSPAKQVGLLKGDKILAVNGEKIKYWYEIGENIEKAKGDIELQIIRKNKTLNFTIPTTIINGQNEFQEKIKRKIIGIAPALLDRNSTIHFTPFEALFYAYNETIKASILIATGVKKMSTGEVSHKQVGGAITIFDLIIKFAELGFVYLLFIMAIISVNLGVMNLLPIPALDGGHIMFNLYELITRREPSQKAIMFLTFVGWGMLAGLMTLGLYNDINRIWGA